jgi:hypothetical protein
VLARTWRASPDEQAFRGRGGSRKPTLSLSLTWVRPVSAREAPRNSLRRPASAAPGQSPRFQRAQVRLPLPREQRVPSATESPGTQQGLASPAAYDLEVSKGQPLNTPVDAAVVVLVDEARDGRLAICAGAGISIASGLPGGPELARRLDERFQRVNGYTCGDPDDLLAVADAASKLDDGLAAVQSVVLELAPFDAAPPRLAHRLLGSLVAENALRLLLTNWDDCVERGWRRVEYIPAARNAVEAELLQGQFVLKIHGCCTEPETLLISSAQLRDAPLWTKIYFQAELAQSTMVFVGIGDIADYAQHRIAELSQLVEHARVRLVSPDVIDKWEGSAWEQVLPDLPPERRIAKTADTFLDELAREWVMWLVQEVRREPMEGQAGALDALANAFMQLTAVEALAWLRGAAVGWRVGESVVRAPSAAAALEAVALLARSEGEEQLREISFRAASGVAIGGNRLEVVLCRERETSGAIEGIAVTRAAKVVGRLGPTETLEMLVSAGSLRGPKTRALPAVSVVDPEGAADDLIGGEQVVSIRLIWADEVLEAA